MQSCWSEVWSSHIEPGKAELEHGHPLWPACNAAGTFISVKSPSWPVFSVVVEADFCQFICNSFAAAGQWRFPPPFLVSVSLWDQPRNAPGLSLTYSIQIQVMIYFKMVARCNLWKRWQTAAVLLKIRWSQKGRTKPSAFWPLNAGASSNHSLFKNFSWNHVELMELIISCLFETFLY